MDDLSEEMDALEAKLMMHNNRSNTTETELQAATTSSRNKRNYKVLYKRYIEQKQTIQVLAKATKNERHIHQELQMAAASKSLDSKGG